MQFPGQRWKSSVCPGHTKPKGMLHTRFTVPETVARSAGESQVGDGGCRHSLADSVEVGVIVVVLGGASDPPLAATATPAATIAPPPTIATVLPLPPRGFGGGEGLGAAAFSSPSTTTKIRICCGENSPWASRKLPSCRSAWWNFSLARPSSFISRYATPW